MNIDVITVDSPTWLGVIDEFPHDIYHLPQYIKLEAKRNQSKPEGVLIYEKNYRLFIPYLLRECHNLFNNLLEPNPVDVTSPYGYPGILVNETDSSQADFVNRALFDFQKFLLERDILSAFLRLHPILNRNLYQKIDADILKVRGETVFVNLEMDEAGIWQETRPEHRNHINRCKRANFMPRVVSLSDYIDEFISIYYQTMERVQASRAFFFNYGYFQELAKIKNHVHLCLVEKEGEIACGGIFTECSGIAQYHLGATNNKFLKEAPSKLMFDYIRFWFKQRGNRVLHLGGGLGSQQDNLYRFKAGFSKSRSIFSTLHIIPNQEKYISYVEDRAKSLNKYPQELIESGFFPAYRCS